MLEKTSPDFIYKLFAVVGTVLVVLTPYVAWQRLNLFEQNATSLFEQRILADLDLKSLKSQFHALQRAVESANGESGPAETMDYSASQLRQMVEEAERLSQQIEQSYTELQTLDAAKRDLTGDFKWLFVATLLIMAVGMVLAVFGLLGWFFHIRILRDRRTTPRED